MGTENPRLESLDLGKNAIGDEGAAGLAEGAQASRSLQYLWLDDNNIGESGSALLAGCSAVRAAMGQLEFVSNFDADSRRLQGGDMRGLLNALRPLQHSGSTSARVAAATSNSRTSTAHGSSSHVSPLSPRHSSGASLHSKPSTPRGVVNGTVGTYGQLSANQHRVLAGKTPIIPVTLVAEDKHLTEWQRQTAARILRFHVPACNLVSWGKLRNAVMGLDSQKVLEIANAARIPSPYAQERRVETYSCPY